MGVALAEVPVLAHVGGVRDVVDPADPLPVGVLGVVEQRGLDQHNDAVGAIVTDVAQPHVGDLRVAERLDPVAPALTGEVVEAALPFGEQGGRDQRAQLLAVIVAPGRLDVEEQPPGRGADHVGGERGVVLGGLGGGQLDAPLALGDAAAACPSTRLAASVPGRDPGSR